MKITGIKDGEDFGLVADDVIRARFLGNATYSEISSDLLSAEGNVLPTSAGVATGILMAAEVLNDYIDDAKQDKLYNVYNDSGIEAGVLPVDGVVQQAADAAGSILYGYDTLNSVLSEMRGASGFDDTLTTAAGVVTAVAAGAEATKNYTDSKRVRIYTTWGTDTVAATTLVPFENAQ